MAARTGMPYMADVKRDRSTAYFALAFVCVDGDTVTGQPVQCIGASAAIRCAQGLVNRYGTVGALALRKSEHHGDSLHVLCAFGDVPQGERIDLAGGWHIAAWDEEWSGVDVVG
jgi:hypothetical protein